MNSSCQKRLFCLAQKSFSIESYDETDLDEYANRKRTFSFDKSPRKINRLTQIKPTKPTCCLIEFCHRTKTKFKAKKQTNVSDSTSSSVSIADLNPCVYCSNENSLPVSLCYAVERYLSSISLNTLVDCQSVSSKQTNAEINETEERLSLCEINEIIYAIHMDMENDVERKETLDALASSLREVAEEIPVNTNSDEIVEQPATLGRILARAVVYEIVMRLFSFYLFLLAYCI